MEKMNETENFILYYDQWYMGSKYVVKKKDDFSRYSKVRFDSIGKAYDYLEKCQTNMNKIK